MPKLIKTWEELNGLETEDYKIRVCNNCCAWIEPKVETEETETKFFEHHTYLSTHTFYGLFYKDSTRTLQRFGFDVEIDNWDKES